MTREKNEKVYYYPRVQNSQRNKGIRSQDPVWYIHLNPRPFRPNGRTDGKLSPPYQQSVYEYLMKSLAESSIMGINKIASARNCNVWILVLVICMSGFFFQSFWFLKVYHSKPSVVHIYVENDGSLQFPAFTICGRNRFRKTVFCPFMPKKCELLSHSNRSEASSLVVDVTYDLLAERNAEKLRELGHSSDMITDCQFHGYPEVHHDECHQMLEHFYDPYYGNCYTIPPKNLKGQVLKSREPDIWDVTNDLTILLDMETEEILELQNPTALFASVHDDSLWPDMSKDGIIILPGFYYNFDVKKSSVHLLPPPYKSNCSDISKLPWQKNFKRRLSSRRCSIGCSQHYQLKKCNFVTKILSTYYDVLPFDPKIITEDDRECAEQEEERTQDYCRKICGLACRVPYFDTAVSRKELTRKHVEDLRIRSSNNRTWEENMKNLILVKISYATLEHTFFKQTPKYDTMELFSYLGSYSGMCLGFSLLTVYEMVDVLLSTCLFAYHKHQRAAQRKRRQLKITPNSQGCIRKKHFK